MNDALTKSVNEMKKQGAWGDVIKEPRCDLQDHPIQLEFACDFMTVGNGTAALQAWSQSDLQKMSIDAKAALAKDLANPNSLKAP